MSARSTMTMRATVTRDTTTDVDAWGTPDADTLVEVSTTVPCRVWSKLKRDVDDAGKTAVVEDLRAMVPADADIEEGDRLVIKDRQSVTQFAGAIYVEAVARVGGSGSKTSHQLLMLTRHK